MTGDDDDIVDNDDDMADLLDSLKEVDSKECSQPTVIL